MEGSATFSCDPWGIFAGGGGLKGHGSGGLTRVLQGGEVIEARKFIGNLNESLRNLIHLIAMASTYL